jgi:hypothetical protein
VFSWLGGRQHRAIAVEDKRLPSFFIVGPPRTGSSWLHEVLAPSAVLPAPTKETRFFDQHFRKGLDWYLSHFPYSSDQKIVGEVAPTYFASANAREHISKLIPNAKLVCVFRNPVERVFSLYRLKRAHGMFRWSFEQAIQNDSELLESSRYATHLKEWLNTFGEERVFVTVYEDMKSDPQAFLNSITQFLAIPNIRLSASQTRFINASEGLTHPRSYFLTRAATETANWFKAVRLDRVLAAAKRQYLLNLFLRSGSRFESLPPDRATWLYELFRPEVEELESMLNRDFTGWKSNATTSAIRMTA